MKRVNRRKTLPAMPAKVPAELRPLFAAMMEIMEVGEGVRGDKLDRKITMRDLLDGGLASLRVQGNPDAGLSVPPGPQNMAIPPRPTGFAADGSFFGMVHLSWEVPQSQYNNHSITNIYRSEEDNFATAEVVGREPGMFYSDRVRDDSLESGSSIELKGYYYWITYTSDSNIEGPPNSPDGTFAKPLIDTEYLLGQLSGQLGESELSNSLKDRIDKIDGPKELDGSVAQKLSKEADARLQAIADERSARIAAITGSLGDAKSYADAKVTQEQQARADGLEAIATQIEQLEAGLGEDYTVGMIVERQARIDGDKALASSIQSLTAYAEGTAADIVSEQQARVSADEALASDVSALYVESGNIAAGITNESLARIAGDKALSAVQQVISAANSVASAAFKVSSQVFIDENSAMATRTEELRASFEDANSLIRDNMLVLASADEAQAQLISEVQAEVDENRSTVQSVSTALADAKQAIAEDISTVQAGVDQNLAAVQSEASARADAVAALARQVDTVRADVQEAIENIDIEDTVTTVVDLSSLDANTYYPVIIRIGSAAIRRYFSVGAPLSKYSAPWATHNTGTFSCSVEWSSYGSGWGAQDEDRIITTATHKFADQSPFMDAGQLTQSSTEYIFLRGGTKYDLTTSEDFAPELIKTSTTISDQVIAPKLYDTTKVAQTNASEIYAAVQVASQAVAEVDGKVSAMRTVTLDVNGYISGHGSYNDGKTADFAVLADRFWVAQPGNPNSATKPFMIVNGKVYIDSATIREGSIEEGKLGSISFGKLTDSQGNPIVTLGGLLRADMIDVNNLRVGNANISGDISSTNYLAGVRGWILKRSGDFEINAPIAGRGRTQINNLGVRVYDNSGNLRVKLGDLR